VRRHCLIFVAIGVTISEIELAGTLQREQRGQCHRHHHCGLQAALFTVSCAHVRNGWMKYYALTVYSQALIEQVDQAVLMSAALTPGNI
jgi:hypothetical protein